MNVNAAAKALIKKWEGCRLTAYKCSAGVWTIGYGHTSAAGAPVVKPGMKITQAEANRIFDADIEKFATGVESLIKAPVNSNEFGAMVSLAFNIGLGAFAKSSVLRFVNAGRYDDAADAFLLWNKAGGRVLPGLVKRRAEEAAMFKKDGNKKGRLADRVPDAPKGKSPLNSSTNIAAGMTAAAGVTAAAKDVVDNTTGILSAGNFIWVLLILIILGGAGWIIYQRYLKSRDWAV